MLLLGALLGVACGFVWEWVWTPPTGVSQDGVWVLDAQGLPTAFSGTGLFVVVGAIAGLLLGVVAALGLARHELVTLGAVVAASAVATVAMWAVGTALGPPDPDLVARASDSADPIPGDLRVEGLGAFLALPAGAQLGATGAYLFVGRDRPRREGPDELRRTGFITPL